MSEKGESPPSRRGRGGRYRGRPRRNDREFEGASSPPAYEKKSMEDEVAVVTNRVYVSNLAYHTTWQNLKDHMRTAGEVVYADVFTDDKGRSKGCGIVEYQSADEALNSINTLNETKLGGREIYIREDREDKNVKKYDSGGLASNAIKINRAALGTGSGGAKKSSEPQESRGRQIFVGNLPYSTSWQDLKDAFRECGNVLRADILLGPDGRSKGQGTVLFETSADAQKAIDTFNNHDFNGRVVNVHEDKFA